MAGNSTQNGMIWMVASAAFLAIGNSLVKAIALELHPFQIGFLANLTILVLVWPAIVTPVSLEGRIERRKLYAMTALIGGVTNLTWFYALATVPLAEATAITFAAPIVVTALAGALLGEKVPLSTWLAVVAGFMGVLLIVRPGIAEINAGVLAVLVSTCGMASTYLLSKRITRVDSTRRAAAIMTAIPVVTGCIPAFLVWKMPTAYTIIFVLMMATAMFCGRIAMLNAFRNAPATTVMPFDFARLPFIAGLAYFAYGEIPDVFAVAGGSVIIAAAIFVFHQERRREVQGLAQQLLNGS